MLPRSQVEARGNGENEVSGWLESNFDSLFIVWFVKNTRGAPGRSFKFLRSQGVRLWSFALGLSHKIASIQWGGESPFAQRRSGSVAWPRLGQGAQPTIGTSSESRGPMRANTAASTTMPAMTPRSALGSISFGLMGREPMCIPPATSRSNVSGPSPAVALSRSSQRSPRVRWRPATSMTRSRSGPDWQIR